jgi:small-conductance mechanosensitive channel/CRP-like cAMP-binding protein
MTATARKLILPAAIFTVFVSIFAFGNDALREFSSRALGRTFDYLPYFLGVGAWLSAAFFANRLVNVFLWQTVFERLTGAQAPRLLTQLSGTLIFFFAVLGIIGIVFDRSLTGVLAASGAMGLVLGLALQTMIRDVFSGVALNIERPFQIGDFIQVTERGLIHGAGRVEEVNWRSTRLLTAEGSLQVIPNSVLGMLVITNFSRPTPASEYEIVVVLDFAVESSRVLRILNAAVKEAALAGGPLADPEPKAQIAGIDQTGVRYKVIYQSDGRRGAPGKIRHQVLDHILHHLQKAGLTPAYPKQDMFSAPMPERSLDAFSHGAQLLARVSLFRGLTDDERSDLADNMLPRQFGLGDVVIRAGDPGRSMFVLVEGVLEVSIPSKDGDAPVKVGRIRPGDFFGEMSLLTGDPRSATITAASGVVAFEIDKEHIAPILDARPALAEAIATVVAERQAVMANPLPGSEQKADARDVKSLTDRVLGGIRRFFGLALKPAA